MVDEEYSRMKLNLTYSMVNCVKKHFIKLGILKSQILSIRILCKSGQFFPSSEN